MVKNFEKLDDGLKESEWEHTNSANVTEKSESSIGFLQSFLARIKLFAMMKQGGGEIDLDEKAMRLLDERLNSPDEEIKRGAITEIEDMIKIKMVAEEKVEDAAMTTEKIVQGSLLKGKAKSDLGVVAKRVDGILGAKKMPTPIELEKCYADLQNIEQSLGSENLGVRAEGVAGLSYVYEQMERLGERAKIIEYGRSGEEFRSSPIEDYRGEFGVTVKTDDLLQIRASRVRGGKGAMVKRLNGFRTNVREELLDVGGNKKLEALSGDDVLKRIQETSEWRANMKTLYGDKWEGYKKADEIRQMLYQVQSQYEQVLRDKVVANLESHGQKGNIPEHIDSATRNVIDGYRKRGSSKYEFKKGSFEKVVKRSVKEAGEIRGKVGKINGGNGTPEVTPEMQAMYGEGLDAMDSQKRFLSQYAKLNSLLIGTDFDMGDPKFLLDLKGDDGVRAAIRRMTTAGVKVSPEMGGILENVRNSLMLNEDGFGDIQEELRIFMQDLDYAEAINVTMEYISRVGLKEASSDWKLAVLFRQLKDMIGRVNPDMSEGFEARQHLRFLPGINSIMPDKFGEIAAQVMGKSNVDLGLSPELAFMMGCQIELAGGETLNMSTAAFKDLLRSEKNSMKLLSAKVDTTDGTLEKIMVEHIYGAGAHIVDKKYVLLADGSRVMMDSEVKMQFSDIDINSSNFGNLNGKERGVTVRQMLNRTHWMAQDAMQFWWYGREWEKHLANYPKGQMESAPKGLAAAGAMWLAYKQEFQIVSRTMHDVGVLGALLQPQEVYKLGDIVTANISKAIVAKAKESPKWEKDPAFRKERGETALRTGELFAKLMTNRLKLATDSEEYEFTIDTVSQEELRLIGNNIDLDNFGQVWQVVRGRYQDLGMAEVDIPDEGLAKHLFDNWNGTKDKRDIRDNDTRFWGMQIEEMKAVIKNKKFDSDNLSTEELNLIRQLDAGGLSDLEPFLENQEKIHGRKVRAKSMTALFQELQFSSVVDWSNTSQGDDPFQYGVKYYQKAMAAGDILVKILGLNGTREDEIELHGVMSGYVPAPILKKFETVLQHRLMLSRTNQNVAPYEIAAMKEGAQTPHAYDLVSMTDSENTKWQVKDRLGRRGFIKEMYRGNFGWKELGKHGMQDSEIEMRTRWLNGVGALTKEKAREMNEQITGVRREVGWLFDKLGLQGARAKNVEQFVGKWGSKIKGVLKKHPLFDDPAWAFWSLANELWEYTKEVGAEVGKEAVS